MGRTTPRVRVSPVSVARQLTARWETEVMPPAGTRAKPRYSLPRLPRTIVTKALTMVVDEPKLKARQIDER